MKRLTGVFIVAMVFFLTRTVQAGERTDVFSEGRLQYTVEIGQVSPREKGSEELGGKGTMVLYLKYGKCRMEMKMNNGFIYTLLYDLNGDGAISLLKNGNESYALKLTDQEYKRQNFNLEEHKQTLTDETREIAGMQGKKAGIDVSASRHIDVFYATAMSVANPRFFSVFPGVNSLPGIPLHYESHETADNSKLVLTLDTVEARPVDSRMFDVPRGYILITMDKYKSIIKK
jgi:hypothetical protein